MIFVKPQTFEMPQESGLLGIYKQIERIGRGVIDESDKIDEEKHTAEGYVKNLIKKADITLLEHGVVYMKGDDYLLKYREYPECIVNKTEDAVYVTTNYKTIVEQGFQADYDNYGCDYTERHSRVISMYIKTNIATAYIMQKLYTDFRFWIENVFSIKHKTLECIIPRWAKHIKEGTQFKPKDIEADKVVTAIISGKYSGEEMILIGTLVGAEAGYTNMLNTNNIDHANFLLPIDTKINIVVTGLYSEWLRFITTERSENHKKNSHMSITDIADLVYDTFKNMGYIDRTENKSV